MQSSLHLHTWHADARGSSTSGQSWTSLNHLKNVLSCVNQWYHLPFRLHSNTWKTTSLMQCLVNTRKYTPRRNPSVRKTPVVFVNSSMCTAITKSIHKMHVTIFHVGKHKRHFYNSPQLTPTETNVDNAVTASTWLQTQGRTCAVYGYYVTQTRYSTWNCKKTTLFSRHYLRNRSTSDIGVFGYIVYSYKRSNEILHRMNERHVLPSGENFCLQ